MITRRLKAQATDVLGAIEWVSEDTGYIQCPGKHLHTGKNSKKDCWVIVSGAPTIHCFHDSCKMVVDSENMRLRKAMSGQEFKRREFTTVEIETLKEKNEQKKIEQMLKEFSELRKDDMLKNYSWGTAEAWEESPVRLGDDMENDWRLLLSLFDQEDIVWNGNVINSGQPSDTVYFKSVKDWISSEPKGNFTCPSTFKQGSYSRSNENVLSRKYLVIESDELDQDSVTAVFKWCRKFMTLRAIVYTGGKSLHGWFDFPSALTLETLKSVLPKVGCDAALFKPAQPVRMPGVKRDEKIQSLIYLNPL
jgi:hypothetical protein